MPSTPDSGCVTASGLADLTFAPRAGRTRLVRSLTRPPLVVQRALYLDDAQPDIAFVYLANPTAGVLEGDDLRVAVHVCVGARAHVTTQAATKLYAMLSGSAQQRTELIVETGGYLEHLPEPTIPFAGSCFSQTTSIVVAPGGSLIYGEILAAGRLAHGECLAYRRYANWLTISRPSGPPLYHEAVSLSPAERSPAGRGLLGDGGNLVLGTLLIVTAADNSERLRHLLQAGIEHRACVRTAVATLPGGDGVAIKAQGPDIESVRLTMRDVVDQARSQTLCVSSPTLVCPL